MNYHRYVLVFLLALPCRAVCQQEAGTIVVFRLLSERAVIAADSKTNRRCPGVKNPIVCYGVCKILAFDNKYIFAASGYSGRFDSCQSSHTLWNIRDITKNLYRDGRITGVDDFAQKWSAKMLSVLSEDAKISPPRTGPEGQIVIGIFMGVSEGKVTGRGVLFQFEADRHIHVYPHPLVASERPQDMGYDDPLLEFQANKTARAKVWHRRIDKLAPDDQIIALAKLDRDFDKSGEVGGQIDAIRITAKGVEWLAGKPACKQAHK
jgi:hypothetical protein